MLEGLTRIFMDDTDWSRGNDNGDSRSPSGMTTRKATTKAKAKAIAVIPYDGNERR
jgi:hypothetical protein